MKTKVTLKYFVDGFSSNQQNMKNKSGNTASSPAYEYPYQTITKYEIFGVFFVE